jgi:hypothetical protein
MPKSSSTRPPWRTLPASWKTWVPRERSVPWAAYALPAVGEDGGDRRQGEHVVDDRRSPEQARQRGDRWLGAHLAAATFEALEHRGLLAADVGTGTDPHLDIEGRARSRGRPCPAIPQPGPRRSPCASRRLRADTPTGRRRSPRSRRPPRRQIAMPSSSAKGSPSMSIRSAKVPESPSSALAQTNFRPGSAPATVRHFTPVGKPAPPRPRRPDDDDLLDDRGGCHRQGPSQPDPSAVRGVVLRGRRVDDHPAGRR